MELRSYTEIKRGKEEKEMLHGEKRRKGEKELALRALIKAKPLCISRLLHNFKPCVSVFSVIFNFQFKKSAFQKGCGIVIFNFQFSIFNLIRL